MKEIYIKQGKHRCHTTVFLVFVQVGCMTAKKKSTLKDIIKPFRNPQVATFVPSLHAQS